MNLERLRKGQRLKGLPGDTWNSFVEVAEEWDQRKRAGRDDSEGGSFRTTPTTIRVRNETELDLDFFSVVGLGNPVISPDDDEDEFKRLIALSGIVPTAEHLGKFAVLHEPIAAVPDDPEAGTPTYSAAGQTLGRAVVHGVTHALVKIADDSHGFADIDVGETGHLITAAAGGAQILWREDGAVDDVVYAIVRIGGGGGGASATFAMITSKTGTAPPFRYAADGATMDADGVWTGGGTEYDGVFNLEEQGSGGEWVNPLEVGDVVMLWPAPGGVAWVCSRSHYRGTY